MLITLCLSLQLILEIGDASVIKNVKTGYSCDMDFKTKGTPH